MPIQGAPSPHADVAVRAFCLPVVSLVVSELWVSFMQNGVSNRKSQATDRTPNVCLSCMVVLHPATITIHEIAWGKRVLAVPHDTSERTTEHLS